MKLPKAIIGERVVQEKNGTWTARRYVLIAATGQPSKKKALREIKGLASCVSLHSECRRLVALWRKQAREERRLEKGTTAKIAAFYKGTSDALALCARQLEEALHG